ncbi:hypothetical protein L1987_46134 [Smallanthus sonchifolius]|uniref:Uncharacterized protein n=1 Tax=Smallanthus sonchifolius TaxID=185202 RepID=A0ACB9FZV9_9ASTR|nr:hypothetical protein L1987_46134 [Smallanthus sonchifolius]
MITGGIDGTALTAIVTGATSCIGSETTRVLPWHGVPVVMGGDLELFTCYVCKLMQAALPHIALHVTILQAVD